MMSKLVLFPSTAEVNNKGHLLIGGCDTVELAAEFGTPLYVFDELGIRRRCAEFKQEFSQRYTDSAVFYSAKAFINKALAQLFNEEGLGLDVVSAGEMSIARSAGFPMERVYFPGNNKSAEELKLALEWGVGRIVVDNFHELELLGKLAREQSNKPDILLRLSPGVDPHTHRYIITGNLDSKFGVPMAHGEEALAAVLAMPQLKLRGLHFHIGSQIAELEPYQQATDIILSFAAEMKQKHGFEMEELSIGGGFAVQYTLDSPAPPVADYAEAMTSSLIKGCQRLGLAQPRLIIEPGRSVLGQSGVALYTVGVVKDIPGVRRYVSVDGGMGDNIRPALYGAEHEAVAINKMAEKETDKVTVAGKFCESGDIIIKDIMLPPLAAGDILAVADCGAYCLPLASNYNASLKPAVVMVKEGKARLIRRRETLDDLTRCDLV
ncbi:MAG: diaminopimelate decarboxylase [Dehalococcoidia bacterium]|nr:diaminopimelate decarboxylase [Dehalococcoidia bacterium]